MKHTLPLKCMSYKTLSSSLGKEYIHINCTPNYFYRSNKHLQCDPHHYLQYQK